MVATCHVSVKLNAQMIASSCPRGHAIALILRLLFSIFSISLCVLPLNWDYIVPQCPRRFSTYICLSILSALIPRWLLKIFARKQWRDFTSCSFNISSQPLSSACLAIPSPLSLSGKRSALPSQRYTPFWGHSLMLIGCMAHGLPLHDVNSWGQILGVESDDHLCTHMGHVSRRLDRSRR